jgi:thiol-disulfide isomerase/thioredoxin
MEYQLSHWLRVSNETRPQETDLVNISKPSHIVAHENDIATVREYENAHSVRQDVEPVGDRFRNGLSRPRRDAMVSAYFLATILAISSAPDGTLLYFTADWCGACQSTKPAVQRLVAAGYPVREVNVDREKDLVSRFRITSLPCFILVAEGREVERVAEATSHARLVQMFDRLGVTPAGQPSAGARPIEVVRGQSEPRSGGLGLPRPLASLARNLGQRREPDERLVQIESSAPGSAPPSAVALTSAANGSAEAAPLRPIAASSPSSEPPPFQPQPQSQQNDFHRDALQATVRLRVDDLKGHSVGTGTIIDAYNNEALVVTCGHIFRDSSGRGRIAVDVFAGDQPRTVDGTLIRYDLERDLGFVAIPAPPNLKAVRVAPAGFRLGQGQPVFSVGCDRGADPSVRTSRITGIDRYVGVPNIEVAGQPVEGRSGGGLFSNNGELIGVCNAADQSDNEGIFASLPAIHWELDRIGQRRIYAPADAQVAQQSTRQLEPSPSTSAIGPSTSISAEPPRAAVAIHPASGAIESNSDTEVICIVRSRTNPQGSEKLLVFERPSRELLDRLAAESGGRPHAELAQQTRPSVSQTRSIPNAPTGPGNPSGIQPIVRAQSHDR